MSLISGSTYDKFIKRLFDIFAASVLLIFFSPLCFITSIIIKLDSPGPVLADVPERVGQNGKKFKMYKFRSMVRNAHGMLRTDPQYSHLLDLYKKGSYKLQQDPRVTRVGRFIRKHSLDEIPQLINTFRGDMSLVGPRAYYTDELKEQQEKYPATKKLVKVVLSVKPGITGFWQVSGRSHINFDKRIEMDAQYVKKKSLITDAYIIMKTPLVMITGRGAV
jgi:lipopolysaccharide/colanic/teichoic acid biosynthesis glycosyltransferase